MQLWETASSGVNLFGSCVTSSNGETLKKLRFTMTLCRTAFSSGKSKTGRLAYPAG